MDGQTDILLILAFTLLAGKLAGHLSRAIGLPSSVGKISAGLLIGPAAFGIVQGGETLEVLSNVGVVLLMFLAGLETDIGTMRRVSGTAFSVAAGGVILPFVGGFALGELFDFSTTESLFLGAILTATSVSITAQTLREMGRLQSKEGTTILAAAVIDDVLGIVILAFVFALAGTEDPLPAIAKMAIFMPLSFVIGKLALGPIGKRATQHLSTEAQLTVVLAIALGYSWAAEAVGGMAGVTGAYLAGVLIAQTDLGDRVGEGISWVGYSFFFPLFFVGVGLKADFRSVAEAPYLVAGLIAIAIVAKVAGCYVGAKLGSFSNAQALRVGVGMMSRGEVALVIAAAGLAAGAASETVFSACVLMALVTTVLTPVLLKVLFRNEAVPAAGRAPVTAGLAAPSLQTSDL